MRWSLLSRGLDVGHLVKQVRSLAGSSPGLAGSWKTHGRTADTTIHDALGAEIRLRGPAKISGVHITGH